MECTKEKNMASCTCTYSCGKRGLCCQCVAYHRDIGQIPGCFFDAQSEKTYDRSVKNFIRSQSKPR
jgi:hypothetical protein